MKYSNVVKFKPKAGEHESVIGKLTEPMEYDGLIQNMIVKTGDDTFCSVGIWESEQHIVNARAQMIELLDSIRDQLEILSDELGVTDPVSGPIIFEG